MERLEKKRGLDHEHRPCRGRVAVVGHPGSAGVEGHHHVVFLAGGPNRVVAGIEQRRELGVGGNARNERPSPQIVLCDPGNIGHCLVDVVEEDLADTSPALGVFGAEVGNPAVVGPDAG